MFLIGYSKHILIALHLRAIETLLWFCNHWIIFLNSASKIYHLSPYGIVYHTFHPKLHRKNPSTHLLGLETYTRLELLRESQSHLHPQNKPCRCQLSLITSTELPSQLWKDLQLRSVTATQKPIKIIVCRWHRTTPFFVSDPCHSSMRPLFTLAPPLESCWVPTSLTPAILQDHEKTKMSVRKVTKQFAVSRVYCSMLFQFFGSGASLDIETSLLLLEFCNLLLGNVAIAEGTSPNDRMWSGVWFWYSMSYTGPDRIWTWHLFFLPKTTTFCPPNLGKNHAFHWFT